MGEVSQWKNQARHGRTSGIHLMGGREDAAKQERKVHQQTSDLPCSGMSGDLIKQKFIIVKITSIISHRQAMFSPCHVLCYWL